MLCYETRRGCTDLELQIEWNRAANLGVINNREARMAAVQGYVYALEDASHVRLFLYCRTVLTYLEEKGLPMDDRLRRMLHSLEENHTLPVDTYAIRRVRFTE